MAEGELDHKLAARAEEFLNKTPQEQMLAIWLNTTETNGHVAEAFERIASLGKELQAARVVLSEFIGEHEKAHAPVNAHMAEAATRATERALFGRYGRWLLGFAVGVVLFAGPDAMRQLVELFRQAIHAA